MKPAPLHLLHLIYNQPQAVLPSILDLAELWAVHSLQLPRAGELAEHLAWPEPAGPAGNSLQLAAARASGVQTVAVHGVLSPRPLHLDPCTAGTDYETLRRQISAAVHDPQIQHIVLDVDSPGGSVAGCFELAREIRQWSRHKPITAVVNYDAYSAAYALASAAGEVVLAPSSGVGSIGVIARHADLSAHHAQEGIKVTSIFAGARKNDLSPHAPLSEAAADRLQAFVDRAYQQFVDTVAEHRGLRPEAIRATEADLYHGSEALAVGLADRLETPQAAINRIASDLARPRPAGVQHRARALGLALEL